MICNADSFIVQNLIIVINVNYPNAKLKRDKRRDKRRLVFLIKIWECKSEEYKIQVWPFKDQIK